jgi:hypothetical protein
MKLNCSWQVRLAQGLLGAALVIGLVVASGTNAENEPFHKTTDWSHRHLIFSTPKTLFDRIQFSSNHRYVQQWVRRYAEKKRDRDDREDRRWRRAESESMKGDWSMLMGPLAMVGQGMYPAKYSFDASTANCGNAVAPAQPDFVVFNTSLAGSSGQASIMAFDNLYSGCVPPASATPTVYWAYNTGGTAVTSPTLSYDGSQVGFVQNLAGVGYLTLIKWKASATADYNNPTDLTGASDVSNASYRACTAPCMTTIQFDPVHLTTDTNSAVFYDFLSDTMFAGSNGGDIHKFTGVFLGTPAEHCPAVGFPVTCGVVDTGWPVTLTPNVATTSPVYDQTTGQVFIGDSGGFLYSVTNPVSPALPVVVKSARLGFSLGIVDSPIVDPVAGTVYVFVSNDAGGSVTGNNSRVFQFATNFAGATSGASVTVGDSSGAVKAFAGDFDNAYYTSVGAPTGNLYVCGSQTGLNNYVPTLWQIPITAGAMGVPVEGPALAGTINISCGPVVEFYNSTPTATDWIFTSVVANAVTGDAFIQCPAAAGCIMSFNVTSGAAISTTTATTGHTQVSGGASGVVVDNSVGAGTLAGASQVYFTPLNNEACATSGGNGGCAIQASQSGLM